MTRGSKETMALAAAMLALGALVFTCRWSIGSREFEPVDAINQERVEKNRTALAPCEEDSAHCSGWFIQWRGNPLYWRLAQSADAGSYTDSYYRVAGNLDEEHFLNTIDEVIPAGDPRWQTALESWALQSISKKGDLSH